MNSLGELLRPISYLAIKHRDSKVWVINWLVPLVVGGSLTLLVYFAGCALNVYGDKGVISTTLAFVQSLPGFYLAALAAVATFNSASMDQLMPGTPPTCEVIYNGRLTEIKLTRRRFLSILFSYLTAASFFVTLLSIVLTTAAPAIKELIADDRVYVALRTAGALLFFVSLAQMLTVTLWGLFYLGERIHTPD